jgi:hypothetical protein
MRSLRRCYRCGERRRKEFFRNALSGQYKQLIPERRLIFDRHEKLFRIGHQPPSNAKSATSKGFKENRGI